MQVYLANRIPVELEHMLSNTDQVTIDFGAVQLVYVQMNGNDELYEVTYTLGPDGDYFMFNEYGDITGDATGYNVLVVY